jgi:ABC-type multidrug transport system fused ATPase/permease subunit
MSELADRAEDFAVAKNAVYRMQMILKTPVTIDDETGKVQFPDTWHSITFNDVSFSYQEKPVLERISFTVKRGEKVGIVGLSGAGKSTLFKLLLKEHESYTGEILFDDIPLRQISKKDYFNHLAVVLQETELFNTSLRENITITNQKEEHNDALLQRAIEVAHVDNFMAKLPEGVDTIIGDRGVRLSGGEKQRVGLARAIFKDPEILLLDEATSHLDIESEEKIQDSLHQFLENVTAIVIAHRLTTIKEMDTIIVIENGAIIESGSFSDLFAAKGRFFAWWEKQKL